jgi:beta-galactosidase
MTLQKSQDIVLHKWSFRRDSEGWRSVTLPHTAVVTDPDGGGHWQGLCEYSRKLRVENPAADERCYLYFHGAMHTAEVSLDGVSKARHEGGYLPFEVDVTETLKDGAEHELAVRLDNRDNPLVPPGKPLAELDFCFYGGLYRTVELRRRGALHVTDAATAGIPMGGGIFVRTVRAGGVFADIAATVHVANASSQPQTASVKVEIVAPDGTVAELEVSTRETIPASGARTFPFSFLLHRPALWSQKTPILHTLRATVRDASGNVTDVREERFGIRSLFISRSGGLVLNGRRIRPRGTNRHQDHPYAGYALSPAAERRDAVRIKEAGFDYVRLSHYPQSKAFLDACDELGILVMASIPGWQFCGGEEFQKACVEAARTMIRRDRNHPSVVLWEVSLNETEMPESLMQALQAARNEELPRDGFYSCGWKDAFDVYLRARQHGEIHSWKNGDKALVISEYGDWEYYAANEGFDQKSGRGLLDPAKNSRALPGESEAKLLQQAANFAEALDDTLASPAATCGQWCMFDYPRGYEKFRASCGVMDFFRLPKFSYHFYRSQRDAAESGPGWSCGSVVFAATRWEQGPARDVTVFTNAEEVTLSLNGREIARGKPDRERYPHLPHPPVVFRSVPFEPGELVAEGLECGKVVARHSVRTPGSSKALRLCLDTMGVRPEVGEGDLLFVRAEIVDEAGTVVPVSGGDVTLSVEGAAAILGPATVKAEAGIASFVLSVSPGGAYTLRATAPELEHFPVILRSHARFASEPCC